MAEVNRASANSHSTALKIKDYPMKYASFFAAAVVASLSSFSAQAQACTSSMLHVDPKSPLFLSGDTPFGPTQDGMNCYAWQMFVALNWAVSPGWPATPAQAGEPDRNASISSFGVPATPGKPMTDTTVWQSFMTAPGIFKPNAATPDMWGQTVGAPSGCTSSRGAPRRILSATAKSAIHPEHRFNLSTGTQSAISDEILEATGGWLVDQEGQLVFFERLVGKAEYDYLVSKKLYDAGNQAAVVNSATGLALPKGASAAKLTSPQSQEELGAFELKAAWRNLTGKQQLWDRYLTTTAYLTSPDGSCTEAVVGLVGLHIIHKTASMPNFVWTTFEQVDNVPVGDGAAAAGGYSFNDGKGTAPANQMPKCDPNCDYTTPIQVTRLVATPSGLQSVNSDMQTFFSAQTGGSSVFQHYKLVNVLWDGAPTRTNPGKGATVPLVYGTFQSQANAPVANTTMETYAQFGIKTKGGGLQPSCAACHQNATIAGSRSLASDFSFLLGTAHSASQVAGVNVSKEFGQ